MARDNAISRRTAMKLTGAAAATALVAGCGGDDGGNGGNGGNGNGNGNGGGGVEIDPGETIEFSGQTSEWEGLAPSSIEGESNPTLILTEGEDYTIGWTEGDGSNHNIELRDDSGSVVEDYETEESSEGGEDQMIDFTATSDITTYRCEPHAQMEGDIQVEGGNGGGNGNESEENGNESEENGNESE